MSTPITSVPPLLPLSVSFIYSPLLFLSLSLPTLSLSLSLSFSLFFAFSCSLLLSLSLSLMSLRVKQTVQLLPIKLNLSNFYTYLSIYIYVNVYIALCYSTFHLLSLPLSALFLAFCLSPCNIRVWKWGRGWPDWNELNHVWGKTIT